MMPDLLHQPDSCLQLYCGGVKYARRDASDDDIALLRRDVAEQLRRYAADEKRFFRTKGNTRLELITLVFAGELVVLEKL